MTFFYYNKLTSILWGIEMKEKINDLREQLHSAIEDDDKGKILMISDELDKLITIYYHQYEEKDNSL